MGGGSSLPTLSNNARPPPLIFLSSTTAWAIHAHTAALALLVLTTAHVQIATRLLALGAPGWVWGAAAGARKGGWLPVRLLWLFTLVYASVGGLLHATWYPWT